MATVPVDVPREHPPILAVGGELKSTVCLLRDGAAWVSEPLGDLTQPASYRHFVETVERVRGRLDGPAAVVAHDLHPQYLSTRYALAQRLPRLAVQHHHAHITSVMAEHAAAGPVIGVACDGTGHGADGAVWGCEILLCERGDFERFAHLDYFPLVGGDAAAIETWRPAAALLWEALGASWQRAVQRQAPALWTRFAAVGPEALALFDRQAERRLNAPPTSSLGRVFDGVAFLLGLCGRNRNEAEAAKALEAAAGEPVGGTEPYRYAVLEGTGGVRLSLRPTIEQMVAEIESGAPAARIAARFHETVARLIADGVTLAGRTRGVRTAALAGGCLFNRILADRLTGLLDAAGFQVMRNREVSPGDGGISLGQAYVAAWHARN